MGQLVLWVDDLTRAAGAKSQTRTTSRRRATRRRADDSHPGGCTLDAGAQRPAGGHTRSRCVDSRGSLREKFEPDCRRLTKAGRTEPGDDNRKEREEDTLEYMIAHYAHPLVHYFLRYPPSLICTRPSNLQTIWELAAVSWRIIRPVPSVPTSEWAHPFACGAVLSSICCRWLGCLIDAGGRFAR